MYTYNDDILIASKDITFHRHLHKVLQHLSYYGFWLNLDKCVFGSAHIDFLGHHTDANGIAPLPEKVKLIQNFPVSMSIKHLFHFIGIINFYWRFIPNCSSIRWQTCTVGIRAFLWRATLCMHFTQLKLCWWILPNCHSLKMIHKLGYVWRWMCWTQG